MFLIVVLLDSRGRAAELMLILLWPSSSTFLFLLVSSMVFCFSTSLLAGLTWMGSERLLIRVCSRTYFCWAEVFGFY